MKIFGVLRDVAPHPAYLEVSRLLHVLAGFVGLPAVVVDERPFYTRDIMRRGYEVQQLRDAW